MGLQRRSGRSQCDVAPLGPDPHGSRKGGESLTAAHEARRIGANNRGLERLGVGVGPVLGIDLRIVMVPVHPMPIVQVVSSVVLGR